MVKWKLKCIIVTFIIVAEITDGVILSLFVLNMSNSLLQKKKIISVERICQNILRSSSDYIYIYNYKSFEQTKYKR